MAEGENDVIAISRYRTLTQTGEAEKFSERSAQHLPSRGVALSNLRFVFTSLDSLSLGFSVARSFYTGRWEVLPADGKKPAEQSAP